MLCIHPDIEGGHPKGAMKKLGGLQKFVYFKGNRMGGGGGGGAAKISS